MLVRKVRQYISEQSLLEPGGKVLAAFSGGPDSVALLSVLRELGYDCLAVHVNFHLRGEESDRDEAFVRAFCQERKIPLRVEHCQTSSYAEEHHLSIEMAAREQRYRIFEQILFAEHLDVIAVGHHSDDSLETFFLNLLRGSGIAGLTGIRPKNARTVRPLLCANRSEIENYLSEKGLPYIIDSTNLETVCKRNEVRLQVLPLLENIEPSARKTMGRSLSFLGETAALQAREIQAALKRLRLPVAGKLPVADLELESIPQNILYAWLSPFGFGTHAVEEIWRQRHAQTGRQFFSETHRLLLNRGQWQLAPLAAPSDIPTSGCSLLQAGWQIETIPVDSPLSSSELKKLIPENPQEAVLDADKLRMPLTVRHPQAGDRFIPYGMKQSRLISDFLTDLKLSRWEKEQVKLVSDASGAVVWVIGYRVADPCALTSATQSVLKISKLSEF